MVGGDALAGIQIDVGKAQCQAIKGCGSTRLGKVPVTEFDALGVDIQAPATGAGSIGNRGNRPRLGALPDQVGGVDRRHVIGAARTIDRRSGDHQVVQQGLAGHRVVGVQGGGAVEVEAVTCGQLQGFQRRGAELGVTAQQAFEQLLAEGHARWQALARRRLGQGFGAANVDARHPHVQVTGAVAHFVAHLQAAVGERNNRALGIQGGLPRASCTVTYAQLDARTGVRLLRTDHVKQAVRHRQHVSHAVDEAVTRVITGLATANGIDRGTLLDDDVTGGGQHQHFRRCQGRALPQDNRPGAAFGGKDVVAALTIPDQRHPTDHQT